MTYQILAAKCLKVESMKVYNCLKENDLIAARHAVSMIVGRDTGRLDETGVAKAAIETVAEITGNSSQTAFVMKKLFRNVMEKLQEAGKAAKEQGGYAEELLEQIKAVVEKIEFQEKRYDALNEKIQELKTAGQDTKIQNNLLAQLSEKDGLLEKQQNELNDARATIARLRNEMDSMRKERETLEKRTEELEKEAAGRSSMTEAEPEKAGEPAKDMAQQAVGMQEAPLYPQIPGAGYNVAVVNEKGQIVSVVPVERMERKKDNRTVTSLFSRLAFKKKIDIVKLVAEHDLEIRSGIEKGLSEEQLLVLINNQIPAEQMEEIINIAVYENRQKQEG